MREALAYGLASAETAFVATRSEAGWPVEGTFQVASALPSGWSPAFLSRSLAAPSMPYSQARPGAAAGSIAAGLPAFLGRARPSGGADADGDLAADSGRHLARAVGSSDSAPGSRSAQVFSGVPQFIGGRAVLYDSSQAGEAASLPDLLTIKRIELSFPGGAQHLGALPADLALLIYVGDLSAPAARVRLLDLLRQGGARPLNLSRRSGEAVQVVLADPQGEWTAGAPAMFVSWYW